MTPRALHGRARGRHRERRIAGDPRRRARRRRARGAIVNGAATHRSPGPWHPAGAVTGRAAWAVLAVTAACATRDIVATTGGDAPAYCQGSGPAILVGDGVTVGEGDGNPDSVCTGTVAVRTFARALCTCEGYSTSTTLDTDSFDSAVGPYAPGGTTGDVGLDGELRASAIITARGALAVAGAAGATLQADLHVAHQLDVAGPLGGSVSVTSGGDAHLGAVAVAALAVAGTLTVPAGAQLAGAVTAGATVRAPITVVAPCGCGAADLVDIPGFVAAHAADNQDARIGLLPDRLNGYHGEVTLDLPCGIYYSHAIRGDGALTLRVTGRAALLIDGDLAVTAPLTIALATEDAELDLMVAGVLSSDHAVTIGRADHPARTRVYVGGSGTIELSGDSQLAANLYAPRAAVALSAPLTVFGSLFVRSLQQAAPVAIHYDVDVRRADVACPL